VTHAVLRGTAAQQQIPAATDAINQLRFPSLATLRALWPAGLLVLAGLFLLAWQPGGAEVGRSSSFRYAAVLLLAPVMLLGFLFLLFPSQSPSGVTHFDLAPIGVSNNVVIVDVTAEVGRGHAELRAALDGPQLPAATEAALADAFFPPFAGTFVKPTPYAGNHPFRMLPPGWQTWRLGFVLPDATLAKDAFENLRPIGPLPVVTGRTVAGTLFEVRQTNGKEFHATLQVAPPITAADPNWVAISSVMSTYNESGGVIMNWEVLASRPGLVFLHREGGQSTASLRRDPKTKLHQTTASLELTRAGTARVLLISRIGGVTAREELSGNLRELSAELWRYKNMSAKTVRGAEIELCKFQGKPVTVQVPVLTASVTTTTTATSSAIQRVEISQDKAVVHQARYDGSGLLITFGTGTNRWTPSGRYLDGLFNVTLEWSRFGSGALHAIKPRHGIHMNYRLDGPPEPMVGKLVFHPGTARPDAEGFCVIGEFRPDTGEPLPIAVQLVADKPSQPSPAAPSSITTPAPVKEVGWSVPIVGIAVIGLVVIGGIVLLVWLVRKGGTFGKVVAVLCIVPGLLLAVVLVWYLSMRAGRESDSAQRAMGAASAAKQAKVALSPSATPTPSHFPTALRISRDNRSLFVVRDQAETALHYVFYFAGDFGASTSFSQNVPANTWTDEGSLKLRNGRTFSFRRVALYPDELQVNGTAYDLRKGRVLVLSEGGTVKQRELFPPLAVARDPAALARLLESASPQVPRKNTHGVSPIKSSEVAEDNSPAAIAAAQKQGIASATEDIQAGVFRILAYGDLIPTSPADKDEQTGFRILWVAGSFLSDAFRAETDAYNFAMRDWFWKNRPDWSAAVTLLVLDADGKPLPQTTVAFTAADEPNSKAGARSPLASRVTDDLGFIHAFSAPTNRPWSVAIVRNGKEGSRFAPLATSVAVNTRGGAPNYFLELRASADTPGDVLLTPLISEANQVAPKAASAQVLANRLALAALLQKLHQLPATSDEPGAVWLPAPGAALPVTKRVEVAAQIERLRRMIWAGGNGAAAAPSKAAQPSSAELPKPIALAPPGALFSVEQPVVVGGDMMVRVRLLMADKDGNKQPLDEEIIFKTAKDRATGFVLRWHAYGDKNPQHANDVIVHLVDPDTGVILHRMEGGFGSGLRLTSPDNLPLPAKNKSHLLARPGVHTSFHLIRAETPAAPGAPITDWRDLHAEVTLINRAKERPVPAFQMPTLAPKTAPRP
jgi:hypothetical protein